METTDILPDQLCKGLRIVFCGTAAGTESARRGAYYAGPGNLFWPTLLEVGLVDRRMAPDEFRTLNGMGMGLTDVAKKAYGADAVLTQEDFCADGLRARMGEVKPAYIAFNGKKAASVVLGKPTGEIEYGLQAERLGDSQVFVLPSTSGCARRFWDISHWHRLARVTKVAAQHG